MSQITIDRSMVEQALDALQDADTMMEHRQDVELLRSAMAALRAALEQPQVEQEPVASIYVAGNGEREFDDWRHDLPTGRNLLYTHPQPKREPLTDEQITDLWIKHSRSGAYIHAFARAIEAAHGIKEQK